MLVIARRIRNCEEEELRPLGVLRSTRKRANCVVIGRYKVGSRVDRASKSYMYVPAEVHKC
jgi:hypothetical protein